VPLPGVKRVVLVTIDTLRADHLGFHGYPRPTSPFLDRLAERSVVFDQAVAPMATTTPSHATLMTGLYPLEHGVQKNSHRMRRDVPTLAELLARAGFSTAALVGTNRHFGRSRVARGFALLDEPALGGRLDYRPGPQTLELALQWLVRQTPESRFLLWLHLFDPHAPNHPSPDLLRLVAPSTAAERGELEHLVFAVRGASLSGLAGHREVLLRLVSAYDAEVRLVDGLLERFYAAFGERALLADSLWVVTADHGEGLGSHGLLGHGKFLYEEQVRVPLLVHDPSGRLGARRVNAVVEHTDLLPSLLELLGISPPEDSRLSGVSWARLAAGVGGAFPDKEAVLQRRLYDRLTVPEDPFGDVPEAGKTFALRGSRWKYIWRTAASDELFDLLADPHELRNLSGTPDAPALEYRARLTARLRDLLRRSPQSESVDDETIEQLRALGYVQ